MDNIELLPSTIPQGYILPRIFFPPASTTVLLPITANGTASYKYTIDNDKYIKISYGEKRSNYRTVVPIL